MRIIRRKEDFSKVKDSKDTISNMEKVIGYFGLGAIVSISNNLALNIPNLTGLYNDKRLRYNLENENRYGVLAAYQYGKTFGDIEGLAQGTVEFFGGLSIMGFGGLGAGALTVATDGAAAPAVPLVESAGIALAGHGIGMFGSSLYNMGSDFSKGNFYFSEANNGSSISNLKNVGNFSGGALNHILEGQINGSGMATGYHYENFPNAKGEIIEGTKSKPN
ncbi:hypothetical protein [Clostridium felsineum]|uniref:hypothetical protein n=1 Tax=Clostridium felsineum TaxID=36839 RepID=UPI0009D011EC|nr:hypothetical protein [Clostridium felsineum]URZ16798.1 hypothetical protein CLFE_028450 [Clostridium felsineum DSM 794]